MNHRTKFLSHKRFLLTLLASGALIPACAFKETEKEDEADQKERPRLIGRVASIPAGRKFVLVQSYGEWNVETGAILTTQGPEGRTANLRTTGEKLGQFAAADVQSGNFEIGDGVYYTVIPTTTTTTPASASAESVLSSNGEISEVSE